MRLLMKLPSLIILLGIVGHSSIVAAANWAADIEEVYPIRTVRVEHNGRPRGWANPISPIPFVHRTTIGREGADTLFSGVPRGGLPTPDWGPYKYYPPAKLVDNPSLDHETADPNVLKAVLGTYGHSRDKRSAWGRKLTFNRILHFDTYIRFPLGYPLTSAHADSLVKAELKWRNIAATLNAETGCDATPSGLSFVTTPLELFSVTPEYLDDFTLDSFDTEILNEGIDYIRVDDQTFDVTEIVRRWMRSRSSGLRPLSLILLGAENPRPEGLSNPPNLGKHRKRRHDIRWLRVREHRFDNNEWEFFCYHNAGNLRLEMEF